MMPLFAAVLLLAVANGTVAPVVGPEIASTPIPVLTGPPPSAPAAPLVADGNGFLLAFTLSSGVRMRSIVTRLDAQAQAVAGATRELPVTDANNDATMPSVAVAPNGYFAVQTEIAPRGAVLAVWHLNRNLTPDPAPFAIVAKSVTGPAPAPGFVRIDGNRVIVIADDLIAEYDLGGTPLRMSRATFAAGDALFAGSALVTAGAQSAPPIPCFYRGLCSTVPAHFDALVGFDGTNAIRLSYPFYSPNGIAAASDGSKMLYVFVDQGSMAFLRYDMLGRWPIDVAPQLFGNSFAIDSPQRPSVATDGTHFVAVWQIAGQNGQHAVGAAAIDRDGTVTPIAIPSLGDETGPFVLAAGPNRFLVSYLSRRDGEYRVAGRFLAFGGRRPAAGR
jgi:hypothetical protein